MDKTNGNTGNYNTGYRSAGVFCTNASHWNTGHHNTGDFNSCDFTEEKIRIFNMPSDLTASEFYASKYYKALCSAPFILTEWIDYTEEEKDTEEKRALGGCLKTYTYEEACAKCVGKG